MIKTKQNVAFIPTTLQSTLAQKQNPMQRIQSLAPHKSTQERREAGPAAVWRHVAVRQEARCKVNTKTWSVFLVYLLMARWKVENNKAKQKRHVESGRGSKGGNSGVEGQ